jgi:1-acyl-sn-glycerol-3-phosphate acyltransferase
MAREYHAIPVLRRLFRALQCIPVNRDGNDLAATKVALKALRSGGVIGIFPQGGIRDPEETLEGKSGVGLLALRSGASVIPARVEGSPSHHSVLKALLTPSRTVVYVGQPLPFARHRGRKPSREEIERVTSEILDAIASLKPTGDSGRPVALS